MYPDIMIAAIGLSASFGFIFMFVLAHIDHEYKYGRVEWYSIATGYQDIGEPILWDNAVAWAEYANETTPGVIHCVVPVQE
jgi:hypothetical protein